jgi:hypothetical protein
VNRLDGSPFLGPISRRRLLQHGGMFGLAGAMSIEWRGRLFSPAEARAHGVPLTTFTPDQARTLAALGEVLLPGASAAGLVEFTDHQLSKETPLLIIRYFDWPNDLSRFYTGGLAALDAASVKTTGNPFVSSSTAQQHDLVASMLGGEVAGWEGPPSPLVYLAVRSDAVDVMYGTVEGFERLDVPYMPHIVPVEKW